MFVRVFDKENNRYYKSIVYGIVDHLLHAIVINPYTSCFELIDYFEKPGDYFNTLYEVIQPEQNNWITYDHPHLLEFNYYCRNRNMSIEIKAFSGYEDVFSNHEFLSAILESRKMPVGDCEIKIRQLEDTQEWNYIFTQSDANDFLKLFVGFHDSTLDKLVYEEDYSGHRNVTAIFDNSEWYGIIEMCFEGLIAMNIRPPQENMDRYIYSGTLLVKDECVFWADDYMTQEDLSYDGSYVKALNLKWRKIG